MKKLIAILLVTILMVMTLSACEGQKNANGNNGTESDVIVEETVINKTNTSGTASGSTASGNNQTGTSGNASNSNSTLLYNDIKLENYVILGNYLGMQIDTTTSDFKELYKLVFADDISVNKLYKSVENDKVADGDIVNLDYTGKINGTAFDGGTATGYDLEIGSGTFIDDFEEELIGAKVGETRDVTAKFPSDYHATDLAGKEAVFTCKINKINRPMTEAEAYGKMNFKSEAEYKNNITMRAAKSQILQTVCENAKIKDYPEYYVTIIGNAIYEHAQQIYQSQYNQDFDQLLQYNGISAEDYKESAATELMYTNMVMYCIFNKENLKLDSKTLSEQNVEQPIISQSYAVQEIVLNYLYKNAKIK